MRRTSLVNGNGLVQVRRLIVIREPGAFGVAELVVDADHVTAGSREV
jgi:hypothetical protein